MYAQPVALNEKLYAKGMSRMTETVLEYIPEHDQWAELPPPPVYNFTVVTLRGQLLAVGGRDKTKDKETNKILSYNEHSQKWIQSHPAMPIALTSPAVIGYQDHLIVAGGTGSSGDYIPDVNILNTVSKKWTRAQPLPRTADKYTRYCLYNTVLIEDNMHLLDIRNVLRANVPTLISGAKSGVWETLPNIPHRCFSPINIGNALLTVGGEDNLHPQYDDRTTSIQMYDPTTNQWTRVSDLPEPMEDCHCTVLSEKLYILGGSFIRSVFVATASLDNY